MNARFLLSGALLIGACVPLLCELASGRTSTPVIQPASLAAW
jgi:hypothetical protein